MSNEKSKMKSISNLSHIRKQTPFDDKRYSSCYNRMVNANVYTGFKRNLNNSNDKNTIFLHSKGSKFTNRYSNPTNNVNLLKMANEGGVSNGLNSKSSTFESNFTKLTKNYVNLSKGNKNTHGNEENMKGNEGNTKVRVTKSVYNRFTEIVTSKIRNFTLLNSKSVRSSVDNEGVSLSNDTTNEKEKNIGSCKGESNISGTGRSNEKNNSDNCNGVGKVKNKRKNHISNEKKGSNLMHFMGQLNIFQNKCTSANYSVAEGEQSENTNDYEESEETDHFNKVNGNKIKGASDSYGKNANKKNYIKLSSNKNAENYMGDRNESKLTKVSNYLCSIKNSDNINRIKRIYSGKSAIRSVTNKRVQDMKNGDNITNHRNSNVQVLSSHMDAMKNVNKIMNSNNENFTKNYNEMSRNLIINNDINNDDINNDDINNDDNNNNDNNNDDNNNDDNNNDDNNNDDNYNNNNSTLHAYNMNVENLDTNYRKNYDTVMVNRSCQGMVNMKKTNSHFVKYNKCNGEFFFPFQKRNSTLHNPLSVTRFFDNKNKIANIKTKEEEWYMHDMNSKQMSYSSENKKLFITAEKDDPLNNNRGNNNIYMSNSIRSNNIEQYNIDKRNCLNTSIETKQVEKENRTVHMNNNAFMNRPAFTYSNDYPLFKNKLTSLHTKNIPTSTFNYNITPDKVGTSCVLKSASLHENGITRSAYQNVDKNVYQNGGKNVYQTVSQNSMKPLNYSNEKNSRKDTRSLYKKEGNLLMSSDTSNVANASNTSIPLRKDATSDYIKNMSSVDENNLSVEQIMKIPGVKLGKNYVQGIDICSDWLKFNDYDKKVIEQSLKNSLENKNYKNFVNSMQFNNTFYSHIK
ncbi:hypothetical protein PMALA_009920 [Plasmodium malariae]|nr:hypothetical protein PMALA_009920 [Plasmodium malariae]